jgi:hypothetical protein
LVNTAIFGSLLPVELFLRYQPWGVLAYASLYFVRNLEIVITLILLTGPCAIASSWFHPVVTPLRMAIYYYFARNLDIIAIAKSSVQLAVNFPLLLFEVFLLAILPENISNDK